MTNSIWEIIADTPWWVYVVFFALMQAGFTATKPRIISIKQLYLLPILFLLFSFIALARIQLDLTNFFLWLGAIMFGTGLGWLQFRALKIKAIKNEAKLYIPGTWSVMVIILIAFTLKYYYGYQLAIDTRLILSPKFAGWLSLAYGLFTGLFVGRITYAHRCLKTGPFMAENAVQL